MQSLQKGNVIPFINLEVPDITLNKEYDFEVIQKTDSVGQKMTPTLKPQYLNRVSIIKKLLII